MRSFIIMKRTILAAMVHAGVNVLMDVERRVLMDVLVAQGLVWVVVHILVLVVVQVAPQIVRWDAIMDVKERVKALVTAVVRIHATYVPICAVVNVVMAARERVMLAVMPIFIVGNSYLLLIK